MGLKVRLTPPSLPAKRVGALFRVAGDRQYLWETIGSSSAVAASGCSAGNGYLQPMLSAGRGAAASLLPVGAQRAAKDTGPSLHIPFSPSFFLPQEDFDKAAETAKTLPDAVTNDGERPALAPAA